MCLHGAVRICMAIASVFSFDEPLQPQRRSPHSFTPSLHVSIKGKTQAWMLLVHIGTHYQERLKNSLNQSLTQRKDSVHRPFLAQNQKARDCGPFGFVRFNSFGTLI